jgi:hypothetical protein
MKADGSPAAHFCVISNQSSIPEGTPGKVVVGRGPHAGQDMFRLLPAPGVRPALIPLLLLRYGLHRM